MSKRILIVGNGNHQFITNYVKWLNKENEQLEVNIFSDRPVHERVKKHYDNIYQFNFNTLFYRIIKQIKGIRALFYLLPLIFRLKEFQKSDFIHIHYLSIQSAYLITLISKLSDTKIITTIWGSDFYKYSKKFRRLFLKACIASDKITFANEETKEKFVEKMQWQKNNIFIRRFGLAPLEHLKKLNKTKDEAKKLLKWDVAKIAVTIGYNLHSIQQHIKILNQIANLKNYSDQIELILPVTYGGDEKYKTKVLSELEKLPFSYKVYDQFLKDEDVAQIRLASDIMVQLQVTDQFSGSMQEYLFTRNVVITGNWLPYKTMIDHGIEFIKIDSITELSAVLQNVLNQYESYYQKTVNSPETIFKLSSWESNIPYWLQLYK